MLSPSRSPEDNRLSNRNTRATCGFKLNYPQCYNFNTQLNKNYWAGHSTLLFLSYRVFRMWSLAGPDSSPAPSRLCEEGWSTGLLTGGTLGRLDSRAPETCPEADLSPPAWESQTLRPSAHMKGLQISLEPPRGTGQRARGNSLRTVGGAGQRRETPISSCISDHRSFPTMQPDYLRRQGARTDTHGGSDIMSSALQCGQRSDTDHHMAKGSPVNFLPRHPQL